MFYDVCLSIELALSYTNYTLMYLFFSYEYSCDGRNMSLEVFIKIVDYNRYLSLNVSSSCGETWQIDNVLNLECYIIPTIPSST